MNQGYFFECLNFCKVMKLPVVLVCENNGYGEYTAFEEVTAGALRARAEVMEVAAETIDGMSVWETRAAAQRARRAPAPAAGRFVEAITYRFVGHSRSDPGAYRKPGRARPLARARPAARAAARLEAEGVARRDRRARCGGGRRAREAEARRPRGAVPGAAGVQRVQGAGVTGGLAMPKLSDSMEEAAILRWLK